MYQSLSFKIIGLSPLLMHNGLMADPANSFSQAIRPISGKRNKTEADFVEIARLEFLGSLYLFNGTPCIPGELVEAAMIQGAMKRRMGPAARAGILCDGMYPLIYKGSKEPLKLWEDPKFRLSKSVRIGKSRVMRTRPMFPEWAANIELQYDSLLLNEKQIIQIAETVGQTIGLGDWRPRFGRFQVENDILKS